MARKQTTFFPADAKFSSFNIATFSNLKLKDNSVCRCPRTNKGSFQLQQGIGGRAGKDGAVILGSTTDLPPIRLIIISASPDLVASCPYLVLDLYCMLNGHPLHCINHRWSIRSLTMNISGQVCSTICCFIEIWGVLAVFWPVRRFKARSRIRGPFQLRSTPSAQPTPRIGVNG